MLQNKVADALSRALNDEDIFQRCGVVADNWQKTLLSENEKRVCCVTSRQAGKSLTACAAVVQHCGARPGSLAILASPSEQQSKENISTCKELLFQAGYGGEITPRVLDIAFKNKSRIIGVSGDRPANIRGYSASLICVDEFAHCKHDEELWTALTPMIATKPDARVLLISTPNGPQGVFYRIYKFNETYSKIIIPASQIARIPKEFLEQERADKGEALYRQEYFCDFNAMENQLLAPEIIESTFVSMGTIDSPDHSCITTTDFTMKHY